VWSGHAGGFPSSRSRDQEARSEPRSGLDLLAHQSLLCHRAAGIAHGSDAVQQKQLQRQLVLAAGEMAVHVDQSREHPVPGHVVLVRLVRDRHIGSRPDLANAALADQDSLIRGAGLTDHVDDRGAGECR
jgi:hypothetical protein